MVELIIRRVFLKRTLFQGGDRGKGSLHGAERHPRVSNRGELLDQIG